MLVGIASGTYSSIFIASPVLTAWKEREPGFVRRRERIAALEGNVPAFADETELARLEDDGETDVEIEEEEVAAQREPQPKAGAVATVEPPATEHDGDPRSNGEPPATDPAEAAKRERDERRRERRKQRRKHGRKPLMALLVWFTMGIALWHFTVFLPDRFWQGIVGAFIGATVGAVIFGSIVADRGRQRPRRDRPGHSLDRGPRHGHRAGRRLVHRHPRRSAAAE